MDNSPRFMEVPGIPGQLKEANLEEFMSALPMDHLAQRQLSELRRLAMDGAKATAELLEALKKIRELEARLGAPPQVVKPEPVPEPMPYWPNEPCPICKQEVSSRPGPWARHMKHTHHITEIPKPTSKPIGYDTPTAQSTPRSAAA